MVLIWCNCLVLKSDYNADSVADLILILLYSILHFTFVLPSRCHRSHWQTKDYETADQVFGHSTQIHRYQVPQWGWPIRQASSASTDTTDIECQGCREISLAYHRRPSAAERTCTGNDVIVVVVFSLVFMFIVTVHFIVF